MAPEIVSVFEYFQLEARSPFLARIRYWQAFPAPFVDIFVEEKDTVVLPLVLLLVMVSDVCHPLVPLLY
jgi:hypothetical protein